MKKYGTKPASKYGHRVLDPLPTREDLDRFYSEQYYNLVNEGKVAPDIGRSSRGGDEAADQENWLQETVHKDIIDILLEFAPGKRVAEVGCGLGELVGHMKQAGLEPLGIDLAGDAVKAVKSKGLEALEGSIDGLFENGAIKPESFDAIIFNNVLEFTHDPAHNLKVASQILKPGGVLMVRSGNDFNDLQMAAVNSLGLEEWWVSPPGHINYLTFDAVEAMMHDVGIMPFHRHGEFPMELWLLLGFDYISDRSIGADCHNRRVAFERSVPTEVRRRLYKAFGEAGFGRTMFIAGRRA
ncbi:class I SAM-dependent methyltransferase [Nisaea nitritireducens]|uniref:class I SAM-dependent methyltransferase n=1 Tax=Nisaea nitritireducens TaxID=568392 RepID=UPI001868B267|nr:class I SAM-dependent methyltransferase [Nisaea nitritireducens]